MGAEPGEFTRRAFLNGRLDLSQAEAVMDLYVVSTDVTYRDEAEKILNGFNTSFGAAGLNAIAYSAAVHRLVWELRGGRRGVGT